MLNALKINYQITDNLVRGLDYYTKTVFEFENTVGDKTLTVCGGGRYDDLVQEIGGKDCPALGFSCGLDRLEGLVDKNLLPNQPKILVINAGNVTLEQVLPIAEKLRVLGKNIEINLANRSFNAQLKYANKLGINEVYIIGDEELKNKSVTIKNMTTGEQITKNFDF